MMSRLLLLLFGVLGVGAAIKTLFNMAEGKKGLDD